TGRPAAVGAASWSQAPSRSPSMPSTGSRIRAARSRVTSRSTRGTEQQAAGGPASWTWLPGDGFDQAPHRVGFRAGNRSVPGPRSEGGPVRAARTDLAFELVLDPPSDRPHLKGGRVRAARTDLALGLELVPP